MNIKYYIILLYSEHSYDYVIILKWSEILVKFSISTVKYGEIWNRHLNK